MVKKYNYILIDWDGTMAQTLEVWLSILKESLGKYGLNFSDQRLLALISSDWNGMLDLGIGGGLMSSILDYFKGNAKERLIDVQLYPGAVETLAALATRGKKLALVTANDRASLEATSAYTTVKDYFDVILTSDDLVDVKPDPECIYKAVALMEGKMSETILIGDSESDLKAARSAEIDAVLFYPQTHSAWYMLDELREMEPTYVVESWEMTRKILLGS